MLSFLLRRLIYMIPTLFAVSLLSFIIIQLPPGDYLTTVLAMMAEQGNTDAASIEVLRQRYGLDQNIFVQYWKWMTNILLHGDFGLSFERGMPVNDLIWDRLGMTFLIAGVTLIFMWAIALPIGIYSAVRQYSIGDYAATFVGFLGLATPNFVLALALMFISFKYFGASVGGLYSPEYVNAAWSFAKFVDLLKHLWIPVLVVGTAGTAGLIRIMRANLLDEMRRPYVTTARAMGYGERHLILKFPVRVALNPFISTIGWILPTLVAGEVIVSVVMSLPTTGPLLLRSLLVQDMYLAGSMILLVSVFTVIGTLLSDILLAWADPRIRYQ